MANVSKGLQQTAVRKVFYLKQENSPWNTPGISEDAQLPLDYRSTPFSAIHCNRTLWTSWKEAQKVSAPFSTIYMMCQKCPLFPLLVFSQNMTTFGSTLVGKVCWVLRPRKTRRPQGSHNFSYAAYRTSLLWKSILKSESNRVRLTHMEVMKSAGLHCLLATLTQFSNVAWTGSSSPGFQAGVCSATWSCCRNWAWDLL